MTKTLNTPLARIRRFYRELTRSTSQMFRELGLGKREVRVATKMVIDVIKKNHRKARQEGLTWV